MPRSNSSLTIKDFPTDRIEVECKKCGRHGRYRKATLIEKHGSDIVMSYLCVRAYFAKDEPECKHL